MHGWKGVWMVQKNEMKPSTNYVLKAIVLNWWLLLKLSIIFNSNSGCKEQDSHTCITMVVVEQMTHRVVQVVWHEDFNNSYKCTIYMAIVLPRRILPCSKANTTTLRSVIIDYVARKLVSHKQMQTQAKTNTTVNPIDHHTVPAPKWMQFATAPIIVGQKSDKNNPLRDKICSNGVEGACCVMICTEFCSFSA